MTLAEIPRRAAPSGGDIEAYSRIWDFHLWGYSLPEIYDIVNVQFAYATQLYVAEAVGRMKDMLGAESYKGLAEAEIKQYLARNALIEKELIELFQQMKGDFYQLKSGNPRYPDGSKAMNVAPKDLLAMLTSIDRLSASRASALMKMANPGVNENPTTPELPEGEGEEFMASMTRRPRIEGIIDADVKEVV